MTPTPQSPTPDKPSETPMGRDEWKASSDRAYAELGLVTSQLAIARAERDATESKLREAEERLREEQRSHDEIVAGQADEIRRLLLRPDNTVCEALRVRAITAEQQLAEANEQREAAQRELEAERNLHGQTRVVVEELNIICNDLRNAGHPQFIRSEAIRLLREDQASLRAQLTQLQASAKAEGERDARRDFLRERIKQYLCLGGLFNPEMMEHDKVRDFIMDLADWMDGEKPRANLQMEIDAARATSLDGDKGGAR